MNFMLRFFLCCSCLTLSTQADDFLTRDGSQLFLGDTPFRTVGVNKHELLDQYLADLLGGNLTEARSTARASLDLLAELGIDTIRVRASQFWPAQIERTYLGEEATRVTFWARFDEMLSDCESRGIRVIPTIAWHLGSWPDLGHESLQDFVGNPHSKSRTLFDEWVRELVMRYRESTTVLFWELTNEANLLADLRPQLPQGVIGPPEAHPHLVRLPIVRDEHNHMTSDELAAFTRETTALIKLLDPNHLVGTGFSIPRKAAWHLWLGSLRRSDKMDWTQDSAEQRADYLRLITPEPVDLISFHYYLNPGATLDELILIKDVADQLGRPFYCGELGLSHQTFPGRVYDHPNAVTGLRCALEAMDLLDVPIVLPWTWDEYGEPTHEPVLWSQQSSVIDVLQQAQKRARGSGEALTHAQMQIELDRLTTELTRIMPTGE